MYINFKSKYKKIFWLLFFFLLICSLVGRVNALTIYTNDGNLELPDLPSSIENNPFVIYTYNDQTRLLSCPVGQTSVFMSQGITQPPDPNAPGSIHCTDNSSNIYILNNSTWNFSQTINSFTSTIYDSILATSLNIVGWNGASPNVQIVIVEANFGLVPDNPDYLNGYQKITLTTSDKYYMLSGLSSGSVFIPIEDFNSSGGRLSYYDNDLSSQPYTSYIQDYTITRDGLYARQDFNLNNYYGADWVMFSKYIYLEGEDNISYDIWVPEDITYSDVTITPNSSGGNNFDFQYKDSNGDIQNGQATSIDLTPPQPLLSDVFNNFTTNYYGLSSIILSPISFLESVNNATCTPLTIPSPIGSSSFTLPCMTPIYQSFAGDFFTLYQTVITGFIAYYVGLGYFNLIKGLKDPSDDRIEVIHL